MHYLIVYVPSRFLCCLVYIPAVPMYKGMINRLHFLAMHVITVPFPMSPCFPFPLSLSCCSIFMNCLSFLILSHTSATCPSAPCALSSSFFYLFPLCFHLRCGLVIVVLTAGHVVQHFCSPHRDQWDDGRIEFS